MRQQEKLLRVVEYHEFERVGSSRTKKVDVRVISACNRRLEDEVAAGRFREDLFARINLWTYTLPGLAQRREDIVLLAEHFLQGRASLGDAAREALLSHAWPGNVRELKNAVERMLVLHGHKEILEESDLPHEWLAPQSVQLSASQHQDLLAQALKQFLLGHLADRLRTHSRQGRRLAWRAA